MGRPSSWLKRARNLAIGCFAVLILIWAFTCFWGLRWDSADGNIIMLAWKGEFYDIRGTSFWWVPGGDYEAGLQILERHEFDPGLHMPFKDADWRGGRMTEVSIVFPAIAALVIAVILTQLIRLRIRPGCCTTCNYNLTGNTSGICPECGSPISKPPLAAAQP